MVSTDTHACVYTHTLKHYSFIKFTPNESNDLRGELVLEEVNMVITRSPSTESQTNVEVYLGVVDPCLIRSQSESIFRGCEHSAVRYGRWYLRGSGVQFTVNRFFILGRSWRALQRQGDLITLRQTLAGRDLSEMK